MSWKASNGPRAVPTVVDVPNQPVPSLRRRGGIIPWTAAASTVLAPPNASPWNRRTVINRPRSSATRYRAEAMRKSARLVTRTLLRPMMSMAWPVNRRDTTAPRTKALTARPARISVAWNSFTA